LIKQHSSEACLTGSLVRTEFGSVFLQPDTATAALTAHLQPLRGRPEERSRFRQAAALSGIVGSLCLRYGWVAGGAASASDWKIPLNISDH